MLRSELTISEAHLWSGIKAKQTGARFRRQVPVGIWIADFASFDPMLVVEVDDQSHDWRDESKRTRDIEAAGFAILRFTNKEIATDINDAITAVQYWVEELRAHQTPPQ